MNIFKRLFSKNKYKSMYDTQFVQLSTESGIFWSGDNSSQISTTKKIKKDAKPVEVWEILKNNDEPIVDCTDLDNKIKVIEDRIRVLSEYTGNRDIEQEKQCISYLEARKKYNKYKDNFAYPTTNMEMMNLLCDEYTLKIATVNQYSGTMPKEAIDELDKYTKSFKKITKGLPAVRLIVPEKDFKTEEKKRDPILLAESPFGNWFYILGAWDKEVLIVDELIYDGK